MPLKIKDAAPERSARRLAVATGDGITAAVRKAAEERIAHLGRRGGRGRLSAQFLAIGAHCAALPDVGSRSAENILGYDQDGLPR